MPYANAITMIDDLPPMVQLPTKYQSSGPFGQQNQYTNPYFEEVIKDHPSIQGKIRQTEINPMAKYESTMAPYETTAPPNPNYMVPNYPLIAQPPSSVQQNYLRSNMVPYDEERHLPVVQPNGIPVQYKNIMVPGTFDQNGYPTVGGAGPNGYPTVGGAGPNGVGGGVMGAPTIEGFLSCRDVMGHINSCPICANLYHKNDRMYLGIIAILVLLIFIMVFRFSRKND